MSSQCKNRVGCVLVWLSWAVFGPGLTLAQGGAEAASSASMQADEGRGEDGAEAVREAERYAEQAFEAYERGDAAEAIALYQRAYRAAPSADILYNLAKIFDRNLGARESAIQYYKGYIADSDADPKRVVEARSRLQTLRKLQDAESPKQAPPPSAAVDLAGQTLQDEPARDSARPGLTGLQVGGLVTAGVGLVALGVSGGFGYVASRRLGDADCHGNVCRTGADVEIVEDARQQALVSTVFGIGGLVLAGVGAVMYLLGGVDEEATAQTRPFLGARGVGSRLIVRW